MHELGRARGRARRDGWATAPLTAAALAELALADSLMGAADAGRGEHAEAATLVDSLSDDELAGHLEAATWLAGVELYLDRYAEARRACQSCAGRGARDRPGRALPPPRRRPSAGSGASAGSWPRRRSCSTAASRRRGLLGNTHALCWTLSAARPPRCGAETWSSRSPPPRRASTSARRPTSSFHSAEAAATSPPPYSRRASRSARSSCSSSRRAARSWRSSPGARERATSRC